MERTSLIRISQQQDRGDVMPGGTTTPGVRPFSRWLTAIVIAAAMLFFATASAQTASSALNVNLAVAPATLDPAWACGLWEVGFLQNFYVRLTQYGTKPGPDGTTEIDPSNIEPYFARSWDTSDDGLVYTFYLHEGYTFPSGAPVDAAAVKYSFERVLTMNGCGAFFVLDGYYDPFLIQDITVVDDYTVQITLAIPNPSILENWAQPAASIVDPTVVEANGGVEAGTPNDFMAGNVAGSGPFVLESYEPNVRAVLRANPDYLASTGSDHIVVNWVADPSTLLLQARTGQADVTLGLGKQQVHSLEANPAVRIIANDTTLVEQVHLPNTKEPWTNRQVREALTYAVPYEDILERVAFGYGSLFYGPLSPGFPQFNPELSAPRPFDLDRARRLLAESGVALPFDVEMVIAEGNIIHQQIATILQGVWRQLNVNVTIRVVSAAEYADLTQGHRTQAHIRLDGPGVIDAGYFLAYDMICDLGFNLAEVCIPEADELLWQARSTTDPDEQQALYDRITELWIADSPKIMVYADQFTTVLGAAVTDYHFSHLVDMRRWAK